MDLMLRYHQLFPHKRKLQFTKFDHILLIVLWSSICEPWLCKNGICMYHESYYGNNNPTTSGSITTDMFLFSIDDTRQCLRSFLNVTFGCGLENKNMNFGWNIGDNKHRSFLNVAFGCGLFTIIDIIILNPHNLAFWKQCKNRRKQCWKESSNNKTCSRLTSISLTRGGHECIKARDLCYNRHCLDPVLSLSDIAWFVYCDSITSRPLINNTFTWRQMSPLP